jgi:O-antigen/teichoic acid export membrane protein
LSIARSALRGATWTAVAGYLNMAVSFGGHIILGRLLSPEEFGVYALASSLLAFLFMFSSFGAQEAIIQCRDEGVTDLIPTAFLIIICIAIALAALGTVGGLVAGYVYTEDIGLLIIGISWLNVLTMIAAAYGALLQRELIYGPIAVISTISVILSFGGAAVAALIGWGVWALYLREASAALIILLGQMIVSRYRLKLIFNRYTALWIWRFGCKMMISRIGEVLIGRLDHLVVGSMLGTAALGHYSLAYRLAFLGHQFTHSSIQPVAFATYSSIQTDKQKLERAFCHINYWLVRLILLLGILVGLYGDIAVVNIYGQRWGVAGKVFQAMCFFLAWFPFHESLRIFLTATGKIDDAVNARIWQLLFFCPAMVLVSAMTSLLPIVLILSFSVLISWTYMAGAASKVATIDWTYLLSKPILAAGLTVIVGLFFRRIALEADLQIKIIIGFLNAAIYILILFVIERKYIAKEWRQIVFHSTE